MRAASFTICDLDGLILNLKIKCHVYFLSETRDHGLGHNRSAIKVYDVLLKGACSKVAVNAKPDIGLDSSHHNLRSRSQKSLAPYPADA